MTENLEKIRLQDEFQDFYEIATRIRNQKLLTDAERESLGNHTKVVSEGETKLLTSAWQSSYWRIVLSKLKSQSEPLDPTVTCRLLKIINDISAIPAYKTFGRHFSTIDQILTILYNEPSTVAAILNNVDQNDTNFNDSAIQVFFHMLYSCGMYPEDELRFAQIVCELLKLQLLKSNIKMRAMLRKTTSISTRFYQLFVESSHPTMVYLTNALRKGVLSVIQLGNFWLDIDEKQSSVRFLKDNHQDKTRLPEYRALVVSKIVELVDIFLEEIHNALPILPPSLNWIIRNIFCSLYEIIDDISAIELSHACKDMMVSNLLCPAIISPQKFGIIDNDMRIGTIVNHNLVQVAMIIQMISLREFDVPPAEYSDFLKQCRKTHLISEMMDTILMDDAAPEVQIFDLISSGQCQSDKMTKSSFVGSIGDVNMMIKLIRDPANEQDFTSQRIRKLCKRLPESFQATSSTTTADENETSPKHSVLRNLHKKVHQSLTLRKPDSLINELEGNIFSKNSENSENPYFEKENFELFTIEYQPETYTTYIPKIEEPVEMRADVLKTPENIVVTPEPEILEEKKSEEVLIDLLGGEGDVSPRPEENLEKREEIESPELALDQIPEARGGFAKLKSLGDRMKRGITQSNTLSDIRGHLRRSTSLARTTEGMTTSSSDTSLISSSLPTSEGPRNDILEKYASKGGNTQIEKKESLTNLIDFASSAISQDDVEPYYTPENLVNCRAFKDTLRKMTTVLGSVTYLPHINYKAARSKSGQVTKKELLDRFLAGILVEADHRRNHGLAAQLREVKRCIELFDNQGVAILLENLKKEETKREEMIMQLREKRISLMRKENDILSLDQRIKLNQQLTEQNLVDNLMRSFIEGGFLSQRAPNQRTAEAAAVLKFYDEFKFLQAHDERSEFLKQLLAYLKERLLQHQDWNVATESMIAKAMRTMERFVMFAIYETAFYPNLGADQHRDKVLRASIAKVSPAVTPINDYLKIPQRLHGEAPWPSAQAEIAMLDVYVTAHDKLACVVRCCDVINNLIALSSKDAIASADDLTPVLVFVIIKANPRSLLSNVQFVETFAGEKLESGREAYYWTNFKTAVEYIKTIL